MKKFKLIGGLLVACYSFAVMNLNLYAQTWFVPGKADSTSPGVGFSTGVPDTGTDSSHGTVLPDTQKSISDCKFLMNEVGKNACWVQKMKFGKKDCTETGLVPVVDESVTANDILACGIKTGTIKMWMMPYYIRYVLEFIIGISGLVSVGGMVYGGYLYLFAGVSQDKDKGKKAILYSVIGMILTLTAWAFVNIIIALVTS